MVIALLTVGFMAASATGWGALILRACRVEAGLAERERLAWSFALGMGAIGWLAFFAAMAGGTNALALAAICAPGLAGLTRIRLRGGPDEARTPWTWLLLAGLVVVALGDLAEALTPPSDADSLAYHFAIPRQMLLTGGLVFVERAADGAVPLLQQASAMVALGLGGEWAMTLWAGLTGWAAGLMTYAMGRRWLSRNWALAAALVVVTIPAHVYGAGTGQVEARLEAFLLVAVMALAASRGTRALGPAILAGVAVGFAMGSKYPALLVALLAGLILLLQPRGLAKATVFSVAALVAGSQWYGWNWWNSGDPFFPMLHGLVPYRSGVAWDDAAAAAFRRWSTTIEAPLPRSVLDIVLYPIRASLTPHSALESGRTGLGPFALVMLPFAVAGAWLGRDRLRRSPLALGAIVTIGFYVLWSAFGASQRVRHYLPFMPLVVLSMAVAANRLSAASLRRAAAGAAAATIVVQLAGFAVFTQVFVRHLASGEDRWTYLERNVGYAFAAHWANRTLGPGDKLLTDARQWLYLLDVPYHFATPNQQAVVAVLPTTEPDRFWRDMRAQGVTVIALPVGSAQDVSATGRAGIQRLTGKLVAAGCADPITILHGPAPVASRTLGGPGVSGQVAVTRLRPETCPWTAH